MILNTYGFEFAISVKGPGGAWLTDEYGEIIVE